MMDFTRLAAEVKLPGVDMQAVMDSQRRNLDAMHGGLQELDALLEELESKDTEESDGLLRTSPRV